jgi:hypothetical protein
MFLLLTNCLAFFICDILKKVDHVKNTARPMTSEELTAAGVSPAGEEIHGPGNIQSRTECLDRSDAHDSRNRGGEIGSESKSGGEKDLANVDDDPSELVTAKSASELVFGESKVTADLIKEYQTAGFFPIGDARPPTDEQVPTLEANEVVVFRDFLTWGSDSPVILFCPLL